MPSKSYALELDEDEEILELLSKPNLAERVFGTRRAVAPRSMNTTATATTSVFGTSSTARENHEHNRTFAAIVKEREWQKKIDEDIRNLREDAKSGQDTPMPIIGDGEHDIEQMVQDSNKEVEENKLAYQTHKLPAPFFVRPTSWPQSSPTSTSSNSNRRCSRRSSGNNQRQRDAEIASAEQIGQILLQMLRSPAPQPSYYAEIVRHWCAAKTAPRPPPQLGAVLFHRLVYDTTNDPTDVSLRRHEEEAVHSLLRRFGAVERGTSKVPIPNMVHVLESYGAVPPSLRKPETAVIEESNAESLDHIILNSQLGNEQHPQVTLAIRNLGRAFRVWSQLVRARADLQNVFGQSIPVNETSRDRDYAMGLGGLCFEVLLSPLGNRIANSVGVLLESLYERVPAKQWEKFRSGFAKATAKCTDRIVLLADLVMHLLPSYTKRGREVIVEIGFVALRRWSQPTPSKVSAGKKVGVVLNLRAIADIVESITLGINKDTDVTWLDSWGSLLKHVVLVSNGLGAVNEDDSEVFKKALENMYSTAHRRLPHFSVAGRTFMFCLTSLLETFKSFYFLEREAAKATSAGAGATTKLEEPKNSPSSSTRSSGSSAAVKANVEESLKSPSTRTRTRASSGATTAKVEKPTKSPSARTRASSAATKSKVEQPTKLSSTRTRSTRRTLKSVAEPSPSRKRNKKAACTPTPTPKPTAEEAPTANSSASLRRSKRKSSDQPQDNNAPSATVLNPKPSQQVRRSSRKKIKREAGSL